MALPAQPLVVRDCLDGGEPRAAVRAGPWPSGHGSRRHLASLGSVLADSAQPVLVRHAWAHSDVPRDGRYSAVATDTQVLKVAGLLELKSGDTGRHGGDRESSGLWCHCLPSALFVPYHKGWRWLLSAPSAAKRAGARGQMGRQAGVRASAVSRAGAEHPSPSWAACPRLSWERHKFMGGAHARPG